MSQLYIRGTVIECRENIDRAARKTHSLADRIFMASICTIKRVDYGYVSCRPSYE
jgi:hypothetical protein